MGRTYPILISSFAVSLFFQLLRFPTLILENGGGAFLLLFFLLINLVGLPLLIAERAMDNKLTDLSLSQWLRLFPLNRGSQVLGRLILASWWTFRLTFLLGLFCFFVYLAGVNLIMAQSHALAFWYSPGKFANSTLSMDQQLSDWAVFLLTGGMWFLAFWPRSPFLRWMHGWGLPAVIATFLVLFLKIILSVPDYQGLRSLFYPNFSALTLESLQLAIGHSLVCLFIGLGFYARQVSQSQIQDPIEIFIRIIIQNLTLAILIGVMALPMIEQASELAIGLRWILEVLPRWLSYGRFGGYYSFLYFLALMLLSFYLAVVCLRCLREISRRWAWLGYAWVRRIVAPLLFLSLTLWCVALLQEHLLGWLGQSLFVLFDQLLISWVLPTLSLIVLWFVMNYISIEDRRRVFAHQQVFFHSQIFFSIWHFAVRWVLPPLLLLTLSGRLLLPLLS
jgi:neurotransmitter:Na+ symporter, NSS family